MFVMMIIEHRVGIRHTSSNCHWDFLNSLLSSDFLLLQQIHRPSSRESTATMVSFTVYKGAKDGKVYKATTEKGELERDQVLVKVTASGLCGTDLHYRNADMGLGHEGVGIVEELGPQVTHLKKGDRVGWG